MATGYPNFGMNSYGNSYIPMQQSQPNFYKVLPISNRKEVDNIPVDLSGHPTYFHNQMNNEIYIKQFDVRTGLASIQEFKRADQAVGEQKEQYINEFKSIHEQLNGIQRLLTNKESKKGAQ